LDARNVQLEPKTEYVKVRNAKPYTEEEFAVFLRTRKFTADEYKRFTRKQRKKLQESYSADQVLPVDVAPAKLKPKRKKQTKKEREFNRKYDEVLEKCTKDIFCMCPSCTPEDEEFNELILASEEKKEESKIIKPIIDPRVAEKQREGVRKAKIRKRQQNKAAKMAKYREEDKKRTKSYTQRVFSTPDYVEEEKQVAIVPKININKARKKEAALVREMATRNKARKKERKKANQAARKIVVAKAEGLSGEQILKRFDVTSASAFEEIKRCCEELGEEFLLDEDIDIARQKYKLGMSLQSSQLLGWWARLVNFVRDLRNCLSSRLYYA
jgi:hypothetical protein